MSTQPTSPNAADRSAGDTPALLPTATTTTGPADHVTAREIAEQHPGAATGAPSTAAPAAPEGRTP